MKNYREYNTHKMVIILRGIKLTVDIRKMTIGRIKNLEKLDKYYKAII